MTLTLRYNFETRIRVLSKSLRQEINKAELIDGIKQAYKQSELIEGDGYPDLESLEFESETEDFVVHGSNGPITWVGIFLACKYPGKRIRVSWLDLNWKKSKIYFTLAGENLIEEQGLE